VPPDCCNQGELNVADQRRGETGGFALTMSIQGHVDVISLLAVSGWAIDWERPRDVLEISIIVDGIEVATCRTDIERTGLKEALGGGASGMHAFHHAFDPPLANRDNHHIEVLTTQGRVVLPNGRRTLYRPHPGHSRLTPILLSSNGRSGTTMLMQEFATHPDIAVANAYPFEFKLTSYYASAWHVLTQPTYTPSGAEIEFAARATKDMLIGRNPWNRPELLNSFGGPHAAGLIGKVFPDRLARFFCSLVDESYEIVATRNEKSPHFFAEKSPLDEPVRQSCRILFPYLREIVLIRDPRDYLCSAKQFWKHDIDEVIATQATELPKIIKIRDEARQDVLIVRYEDLVLDPGETRERLYAFIGCDAAFRPHSIKVDAVPEAHKTSASARNSIGRFRTELDSATLATCNEAFGAFMKAFDYDV
jgi:hypothetical protein